MSLADVKCPWCGYKQHAGKCPLVKAIDYHEDGKTLRRVEFFSPSDIVTGDTRFVRRGDLTRRVD
jgi:hypothetical protein